MKKLLIFAFIINIILWSIINSFAMSIPNINLNYYNFDLKVREIRGRLVFSWNKFDKEFTGTSYYKLIQSVDNPSPIYDWTNYVWYTTDRDLTNVTSTDNSFIKDLINWEWKNYFRLCVVEENSNNQTCSNTVEYKFSSINDNTSIQDSQTEKIPYDYKLNEPLIVPDKWSVQQITIKRETSTFDKWSSDDDMLFENYTKTIEDDVDQKTALIDDIVKQFEKNKDLLNYCVDYIFINWEWWKKVKSRDDFIWKLNEYPISELNNFKWSNVVSLLKIIKKIRESNIWKKLLDKNLDVNKMNSLDIEKITQFIDSNNISDLITRKAFGNYIDIELKNAFESVNNDLNHIKDVVTNYDDINPELWTDGTNTGLSVEDVAWDWDVHWVGDGIVEDITGSVVDDIDLNNDSSFVKKIYDNKIIILWFIVLIILIILIVFFVDFFKDMIFSNNVNIEKEVWRIKKQLLSKKSFKKYISKVNLIYQWMIKSGYNVDPHFLLNFFISLKSRGFLILLWGNWVWKTAFIESLLSWIYWNKKNEYFRKVIINDDIDDDKQFVWMYDRLNNNYIDPYWVTKLIAKAYIDRLNPYFLFVDEMNMQDIEKYFPYFIDIDKIINEWESWFIKVWEISEADSEDLKRRKINLIKEYQFIIDDVEWIKSFWFKIPWNLFIVGTANIDKVVEPFTGKVIDRSDVIKMKYMWDWNYSEFEKDIQGIDFELVTNSYMKINATQKDNLDNVCIEFIDKFKNNCDLSRRTEDSIYCYLSLVKSYSFLGISSVLSQKCLPRAFWEEYRAKLKEILKICYMYDKKLDLQPVINEIELLLKDDFINYWKIT